MSYESRAYDKPDTDGLGPDPVVVLVVTGTHDVSRLIGLLMGGTSEQIKVGRRIQDQVRRHNGGRAALKLLRDHGGLDSTREEPPVDPCAGLKVGDILPGQHKGDNCIIRIEGHWCSRPLFHPGQDIATVEHGKIIAVCPQGDGTLGAKWPVNQIMSAGLPEDGAS
jgi:hypothetical protein